MCLNFYYLKLCLIILYFNIFCTLSMYTTVKSVSDALKSGCQRFGAVPDLRRLRHSFFKVFTHVSKITLVASLFFTLNRYLKRLWTIQFAWIMKLKSRKSTLLKFIFSKLKLRGNTFFHEYLHKNENLPKTFMFVVMGLFYHKKGRKSLDTVPLNQQGQVLMHKKFAPYLAQTFTYKFPRRIVPI